MPINSGQTISRKVHRVQPPDRGVGGEIQSGGAGDHAGQPGRARPHHQPQQDTAQLRQGGRVPDYLDAVSVSWRP